ncbi:MAG: hypothetical protein HWE24_16705 [Oceanospirillaceae bacterium]|nr:hypothetical protein [Oceanospirillaceae bacterium]
MKAFNIEFWIILGESLIILLLIVLLFTKKNKKSRRRRSHSSHAAGSEGIAIQNQQLEELKRKSDLCNQEKGKLRSERDALKAELESLKKVKAEAQVVEPVPDVVSTEVELVVNTSDKNEFYLNSPEKEGSFYKPDSLSSPGEKSLYHFSYTSTDKGTFELIPDNEKAIGLAFNSPDIFLKTACDYSQPPDAHVHKRIVTISKGEFIVLGDDVKIATKAQIEFQ